MKELHSCIIECITHTHTQETRALKQQPRTATSSSKILAGHRHTRLHHGHGGIVYPTEPRSLLTFCHLDLDPFAVTHAALTHHHRSRSDQNFCLNLATPSLLPPFEHLSPLNICRCIFQTCPLSNILFLLLSLLHAITITISPTVYPTVKPRFDKSCSRLGGGGRKGCTTPRRVREEMEGRFLRPGSGLLRSSLPSPLPPVRNVREITPGDHGIHGSERWSWKKKVRER